MARTLGGGVLLVRPAAVPALGRTARRPLQAAREAATAAEAAADLTPRRPTPATVAEDVAPREVVGDAAAAALRPAAGAIAATAPPPRAQDRKEATRSPARGRTRVHAVANAASAIAAEGARAGAVRLRPLLRRRERRGRRMRMAHRARRPVRSRALMAVTNIAVVARRRSWPAWSGGVHQVRRHRLPNERAIPPLRKLVATVFGRVGGHLPRQSNSHRPMAFVRSQKTKGATRIMWRMVIRALLARRWVVLIVKEGAKEVGGGIGQSRRRRSRIALRLLPVNRRGRGRIRSAPRLLPIRGGDRVQSLPVTERVKRLNLGRDVAGRITDFLDLFRAVRAGAVAVVAGAVGAVATVAPIVEEAVAVTVVVHRPLRGRGPGMVRGNGLSVRTMESRPLIRGLRLNLILLRGVVAGIREKGAVLPIPMATDEAGVVRIDNGYR